VVGSCRRADQVAGEYLLCAARLLGRDDRGQVAAANISHDLARGRVQPADDPLCIDDISGNPDPLDGVCDVAADRVEIGHTVSLLIGGLIRKLRGVCDAV
jgi:hypothetical protein